MSDDTIGNVRVPRAPLASRDQGEQIPLSRSARRKQERNRAKIERAQHAAQRRTEVSPDWQRAGLFVAMMQDGIPKDAHHLWFAERFAIVAGISVERALRAIARAEEELAEEAEKHPAPAIGSTR